jgi:rhodanese-related sulfurtransferase
MAPLSIDVVGLQKKMEQDSNIVLIDVRTPGEFRSSHARGAQNIPSSELTMEKVRSITHGKSEAVYVICQSGGRSTKACQQLLAENSPGLTIVNVEGGTGAWVAAGLPIITGKGVISLDRQMRIVAGSLTLIGVLLGWQVHSGFYGLSAFVGCGLIFAGVSNICPMIGLLSLMPWNNRA